MNNNPNIADKDIDLSVISQGIGNAYSGFNRFIFDCIEFIRRNIIILLILVLIGGVLGWYLDRTKMYTTTVVVAPNFQSSDYLYNKIDLVNARAAERDTVFLKSIGISNAQKFNKITIKPINDIYNFVDDNEFRYKTLELMAEDNDMDKILADRTTSRNYTYHLIAITTAGKTTTENTLTPVLNYLNDSKHYKEIQQQFIANVHTKIKENDILIAQIDGILTEANTGKSVGSNMIYNGNSQLNDIITSKDQLVREQGNNKLSLINIDKIIKDSSATLNIKNKETLFSKLMVLLPLLLITIFIVCYLFFSFYRRQSAKVQIIN